MVLFSLIIFCITFLIDSNSCYIAETRLGHNSVIIHERLLVFGGWKNSSNITKTYTSSEIFYLDLTKQFDTENEQWELILEGNLPVYECFSTSLVSKLDDDIIYLIGGFRTNITTGEPEDDPNLIYMYNYSSITWTPVKVNNAITRGEISGVIDDKGIIYIYGGNNITNYSNFYEYQGKLYNDIQILNVSSTIWTKLNIFQNLPSPCSAYTANLLTNGIIVYIGGFESDSGNYTMANLTLSSMKILKLFDTKKSEWSQMNVTGGDTIDPRVYHSSVLAPDGNIILFGGVGKYYQPINTKIALLNINKDIYEWSIPSSSSPPLLFGHSANLYGNYMIVAFGCDVNALTMNSQIYLFDVNQHIWVTTYTPPPIPNASNKPNKSSSLALGLGLGLGIGGSVLFFLGIIFYKKNKTKPSTNPILEIAGSRSISDSS
ncbi:hypothetical protein Glove_267g62 [Diversispora epigaea]|uniref:Attractin/MKLN-like beta-propeller domain-containing protein n=1 Tax=Diversispora epigaea TaxID=1348612 RepID=A0A397I911_9GLOM|nr:hypothetical protein Glove_267g62 [Diversispora epigaea]